MLRAALAFVLVCAPTLGQGTGLAQTFDFVAGRFVAHPSAALVYATIPSQNAVAVIDTETLAVVDTILVGSNPQGLCLSPLADRLFVCTSGTQQLAVVDTKTLTLLAPIPLPYFPYDAEAGTQGRVFITPNGPGYHGIMQVDSRTGTYLGEFELSVFVYFGGLLEISPDRQRLYFANVGLSPGTLACFNVSTATPTLVWKNNHGDLGGNGQDLGLTSDGLFVSYACGGGNGGYDIFKISTQTFTSVGTFPTGPYPREVVYSPDGGEAYTVHGASIGRWNASTFLADPPIVTNAEPTELAVDRSGRYIFAAIGGFFGPPETRVYRTGFGLGTGTSFCQGDDTGVSCPCSNRGDDGHGCENSYSTGGSRLQASGTASFSADTLVLEASSLPAEKLGIFVQGETLRAHGLGEVLGDGLRCVGGPIRRLRAVTASPNGAASYPGLGDAPVSVRGQVPPTPGTSRYYQFWYRDSAAYCAVEGLNWSNAIGVAWNL